MAIGLLILVLIALAGCQAGPNANQNVQIGQEKVAGFWLGLWHGFIAPFMFIISLFNRSVGIYETHNNGALYNFGFILGLSVVFGGSGRATKGERHNR